MFAVPENSRNSFAMILVPLERGGSRRHFESLPIEIHRRSSEISSLEFFEAGIFCSVYAWFPYVRYPPPHEEISITMFICSWPRHFTVLSSFLKWSGMIKLIQTIGLNALNGW